VITSNRTREVHDALKRRCFYAWIDYPDAARELSILKVKVPRRPTGWPRGGGVRAAPAGKDLFKLPAWPRPSTGPAPSSPWTRRTRPGHGGRHPGVVLKYQDDISRIRGAEAEAILRDAAGEAAAP